MGKIQLTITADRMGIFIALLFANIFMREEALFGIEIFMIAVDVAHSIKFFWLSILVTSISETKAL